MSTGDPNIDKLIFGLLGVVGGVILREILSYLGSVRCVVSDFAWKKTGYPPEYTFFIKIFNERRVGTGLRDVDVKFFDDEYKEIATDRPRDHQFGHHLDKLNLPSGEWTIQKLRAGDLKDDPRRRNELIGAMDRSMKIQLVARLPNGGVFQMDIPETGKENSKRIVGALPSWLWPFSGGTDNRH